MKHAGAMRSQDGATLIEAILSIVLILIIVLVITAVVGSVKDICVRGTNRHEANKLAMYVLEKLLPLDYKANTPTALPVTDSHLSEGLHDNNTDPNFLPVSNLSGYAISYTVTQGIWDIFPYKEIIVTVQWTHGVNNESVSLGVLKRQAP